MIGYPTVLKLEQSISTIIATIQTIYVSIKVINMKLFEFNTLEWIVIINIYNAFSFKL